MSVVRARQEFTVLLLISFDQDSEPKYVFDVYLPYRL